MAATFGQFPANFRFFGALPESFTSWSPASPDGHLTYRGAMPPCRCGGHHVCTQGEQHTLLNKPFQTDQVSLYFITFGDDDHNSATPTSVP